MMKQKKQKSKMTLDKLALITQQGFLGVENRLDKVETNFATKDDLKNELKKFKLRFKVEVADEIKTAIKTELTDKIDKLLTKADTVIVKMEKAEENQLMHTQVIGELMRY